MNVNKLKKTLSVLLIAAFMLSAAGCSMIDYKKAEKLKNDGDYAAAQEMYIALGDYKDSAELADECGYQLAKAAYDSEDYETAADLFDKLGSYKNSAELKQKCDDQILSAKLVGKWVSGNVDVTELVQTTFAALSGDADVGAWYNNCNFDDCAIGSKSSSPTAERSYTASMRKLSPIRLSPTLRKASRSRWRTLCGSR